MYNVLPREYLYSSYKVLANFTDGNKIITRSGTCFLLEIDAQVGIIVTNRHVVDINYKNPDVNLKNYFLRNLVIQGRRSDDTQYTVEISHESPTLFHNNPEIDLAIVIPIGSTTNPPFHYRFSHYHFPSVTEMEALVPGDLICFTGFPNSHDKLMNRPIMRFGRIASDPLFNYSWDAFDHGGCIAFEGFSTSGASGSPIMALPKGFIGHQADARRGFLVGINAGHVPDTYGHSGISYFYKSTLLLEIMERSQTPLK